MRTDGLNELMRARFHGHESPVDPGVWQAIRSNLAPQGVPLEDLMRERFDGHEMEAPPNAWQNIQGQLGQGAPAPPAAGTGTWGAWGWAASGLALVAVAVGVYLAVDQNDAPPAVAELVQEGGQGIPGVSSEAPTGEVLDMADPEHEVTTAGAGSEARTRPQGTAPTNAPVERGDAGEALGTHAEPAAPRDPTIQAGTSQVPEGKRLVEEVLSEMTRSAEPESTERAEPAKADKIPSTTPQEQTAQPELELIAPAPPPPLFMPNTFTPNGDGVNDTYEVVADGFAQVRIRVFSVHNNQLVFSSDHGAPWDGANCSTGHYVVAVEAITEDGRLVTQGKVVYLNADP
ncbi:MAG: gliding motility-associated C-terminal domain-containing protein [Flavobacteriales bacterium]|nr:gliding motility-associated C-terminal domain-containing protein [Flavobacteriales bacterium]